MEPENLEDLFSTEHPDVFQATLVELKAFEGTFGMRS